MSNQAVIRASSARSKARDDRGGDQVADVNVLPASGGQSIDKTGVKDSGYLDKKGTPHGDTAFFNTLPPGSDLTDQALADIREQPLKTWTGGLSFPGDGGF